MSGCADRRAAWGFASLVLALVVAPVGARADVGFGQVLGHTNQNGSYATRGVTVAQDTIRFDIGPSEQGINESGAMNGIALAPDIGPYAAGIRVVSPEDATRELSLVLGLGIAVGISDTVELGFRPTPIIAHPAGDVGDLGMYTRWAAVRRPRFELGLQLANSVPTHSRRFGVGLGTCMAIVPFPMLRIDTGLELEVFAGHGERWVGLDLPVAATLNLTPTFFVGGRATVLVLDRFRDVAFPAGGTSARRGCSTSAPSKRRAPSRG